MIRKLLSTRRRSLRWTEQNSTSALCFYWHWARLLSSLSFGLTSSAVVVAGEEVAPDGVSGDGDHPGPLA